MSETLGQRQDNIELPAAESSFAEMQPNRIIALDLVGAVDLAKKEGGLVITSIDEVPGLPILHVKLLEQGGSVQIDYYGQVNRQGPPKNPGEQMGADPLINPGMETV